MLTIAEGSREQFCGGSLIAEQWVLMDKRVAKPMFYCTGKPRFPMRQLDWGTRKIKCKIQL